MCAHAQIQQGATVHYRDRSGRERSPLKLRVVMHHTNEDEPTWRLANPVKSLDRNRRAAALLMLVASVGLALTADYVAQLDWSTVGATVLACVTLFTAVVVALDPPRKDDCLSPEDFAPLW